MIERNAVIRTTWPGRLAVLGLSAAVLPLASSWAQKPEGAEPATTRSETKVEKRETKAKDAGVEIEVNEDKGKDEVSESLEELKRSLRREGGRIETEVIKSVDRALKDVRKALEDAGLTGPELSRALERTQDDLRQAFERRGSGEPRPDAELEGPGRDRPGKRRGREEGRKEERREERRDERSSRKAMEREKDSDGPRATERDRPRGADDESVARDVRLGRARAEVRALETRLREARERLSQLQGGRGILPMPFGFDPGPRDGLEIGPRGGPPPGFSPPNPRLERRLQELEAKFDRLLKELEGLKRERRPAPKSDDDSVL